MACTNWPTPIDKSLPGVEIQAITLRTLFAESAGLPVLREVDYSIQLIALFLLSLIAVCVIALFERQRSMTLFLMGVGVGVGIA